MGSQEIGRSIGVWITSISLFVESAFLLFFGVFVSVYRDTLSGVFLEHFTHYIGPLSGSIYIIIGILSFILASIIGVVGYGVFQMQKWGQISATILCSLGLLYFPIGTIINIIILLLLWAHRKTRECFY